MHVFLILIQIMPFWALKLTSKFQKRFLSMSSKSVVVHVRGTANKDILPQFYGKTIANAKNSLLEAGVNRFDVLSRIDSPSDFMLIEAYKTTQAVDDHKLTNHYKEWRDYTAPIMTVPRTSIKYSTIFPPEIAWVVDSSATIGATSVSSTEETITFNKDEFTQTVHSSTSATGNSNSKLYQSMLAVFIDIEVVAGTENQFIEATLANCRNSLKEPGIYRFDFLREIQNPCKFCLVEVYNSHTAPLEHKKTAHYANWANTVASMMARPRKAEKYATVSPAPLYWHQSAYITHPGEGAKYDIVSQGGVVGVEKGEISGENKEEEVFEQYDVGLRGLSAVTGGSFNFLAPRIMMGRDIVTHALKSSVKELKMRRPFIVTGRSGFQRYNDILSSALDNSSASSSGTSSNVVFDKSASFAVAAEPTVEDAIAATKLAIEKQCDGIIAIGGGSAMDLGKAVAALVANPQGDVYDYLESVGKGMPIQNKALSLIAIPTTSGTGAEATKNAVLKSVTFGRKASIRHDSMLPAVAIVDPQLTVSCPPEITAHVGLDTLCQLIEPYVCNVSNPMTDSLCREGIIRAARSLRLAVSNGQNIETREDMAIASLFGGISLANAKLGAVHGFAAVLGGMFESAPHGAICAALLPHVMRKNAEKLQSIVAASSILVATSSANSASNASNNKENKENKDAYIRLQRFVDVARMVTGNPHATVDEGVLWIEALVSDLNVPRVSILCGMTANQIKEVCEATATASSTKGNPVVLTVAELEDIMTKAL